MATLEIKKYNYKEGLMNDYPRLNTFVENSIGEDKQNLCKVLGNLIDVLTDRKILDLDEILNILNIEQSEDNEINLIR